MSKLKDLKWMVFKVKQKGHTNYNKKMQEDLHDKRFNFNQQTTTENIENLSFGYNWPYDYFSLIENARLSVDIEMMKFSIPPIRIPGEGGESDSTEFEFELAPSGDYDAGFLDIDDSPFTLEQATETGYTDIVNNQTKDDTGVILNTSYLDILGTSDDDDDRRTGGGWGGGKRRDDIAHPELKRAGFNYGGLSDGGGVAQEDKADVDTDEAGNDITAQDQA